MATKETIPFNYDEVYSYVKKKFTDKGYDSQEGSNTMQLASAMAYLVSMLNANTAVNINETLLTLARKRTNVLNDARVLGYEIQHKKSFKYKLTLEFSTIGEHVIKKYSQFTSGGKTYYFMGGTDILEPIVTVVDEPVTIEIDVIEGTLVKYDNESTLTTEIQLEYNSDRDVFEPQHYVDIPFTDVEDDSIEVFLTYYDDNGILYEKEPWFKSDTFVIDKDTVLNKQFVRIDNITYNTPRIYFKLGDVGKEIRVGSIVQINILQTSASGGAITSNPTAVDIDCDVLSFELLTVGTEEESLASIKQNAPLFHNSANRVVTKPDYIAFSNRIGGVKYTEVWDGHDEYPNKPGHIWFSFVPTNSIRTFSKNTNGTMWTLDNTENKNNWFLASYTDVFNYLDDYKIPTLVYNNRNPVYFDFEYNVNIVRYTSALSESDRNKLVFDVIDKFFTNVETFKYEYFESNLNKRIDEELTDLMGFNNTSTYSVTLNDTHIISENQNENEIRFHLGVPFEKFLNDQNEVITDVLPRIATDTISVDFSQETILNNGNIKSYDIIRGSTKIGEYRVFVGVSQTIEIILYVQSSGGHSTGLITSEVISGIRLDVTYPSPNIRFSRNTLPRLKSVSFT